MPPAMKREAINTLKRRQEALALSRGGFADMEGDDS
jgi:hypothetical protein